MTELQRVQEIARGFGRRIDVLEARCAALEREREAMIAVIEAARALHHFIWEEMELRDPPGGQTEGAVACIDFDDYERHEKLTEEIGAALGRLDEGKP